MFYVEPFACGLQKKIWEADWASACRLADRQARRHMNQWAVFGADHSLEYVTANSRSDIPLDKTVSMQQS